MAKNALEKAYVTEFGNFLPSPKATSKEFVHGAFSSLIKETPQNHNLAFMAKLLELGITTYLDYLNFCKSEGFKWPYPITSEEYFYKLLETKTTLNDYANGLNEWVFSTDDFTGLIVYYPNRHWSFEGVKALPLFTFSLETKLLSRPLEELFDLLPVQWQLHGYKQEQLISYLDLGLTFDPRVDMATIKAKAFIKVMSLLTKNT